MTDVRDLISRMADELDYYRQLLTDDRREVHALAVEARAAALLEQRHPTPVPVAERLPEPEDCDARGWCWYWQPGEECWEMVPVVTGTWDVWSHWLPHCALPIPTP